MPADVVVVGAGAAGLATAIFAARAAPGLRVRCVDGARHIGAKILVSGGSRCNVTNRTVTERDFWGGSPRFIAHVLRAFPAARAVGFFAGIGVPLHEEEDGKLFPDTNRSRTVLDALLAEARRVGVAIDSERRVTSVAPHPGGFTVETTAGLDYTCRAVVLATGGRSLPKTGSDGFGYGLATSAGHTLVDTTPALAPLVLEGDRHRALAGVALPVSLTLRVGGTTAVRLDGPLLWTHVGVSGPVVLNLSRHWHRAMLAHARAPAAVSRPAPEVLLNVCPGETLASLEAWWLEQERARPRAQVSTVLATRLPGAVAVAWLEEAGLGADTTMAHVRRDGRRLLLRRLLETPLPVQDSRGYAYAEVTAGGVAVAEVDAASMESRRQPGLFLVGEILDVDGRLGGFNFQWAWSSGFVAGQAVARSLAVVPAEATP